MMKRLRKPAALLLALVMALTLAACGGGKGSSKTNPVVGKYIGETVLSFDEWVPMGGIYDLGENYIELREDGTGCFMLDGDPTTIAWKLDKDGALTLDPGQGRAHAPEAHPRRGARSAARSYRPYSA